MGNALFGVPVDYTVAASFAGSFPIDNVTNDEPGLVYSLTLGTTGAQATSVNIDFDLQGTQSVQVLAAFWDMGSSPYAAGRFKFRWRCSTTSANRTAGTYSYDSADIAPPELSTNRTADAAKHLFMLPTARTERFWRLTVTGLSVATPFRVWRILLCKMIQPVDNIEAGPENAIDDRSDRRYTRSGRRVIDPTVICPTFKGTWPWLDDTVAKQDFRPLMYKRGGTYPVLFAIDPNDTSWGEDGVFYGDLEKSMSLVPDEGGLWAFNFAIVSIAP